MNETNKLKDEYGDTIQAWGNNDGTIEVHAPKSPILTPDQAIEFAKQLTELAQEVKGNE